MCRYSKTSIYLCNKVNERTTFCIKRSNSELVATCVLSLNFAKRDTENSITDHSDQNAWNANLSAARMHSQRPSNFPENLHFRSESASCDSIHRKKGSREVQASCIPRESLAHASRARPRSALRSDGVRPPTATTVDPLRTLPFHTTKLFILF